MPGISVFVSGKADGVGDALGDDAAEGIVGPLFCANMAAALLKRNATANKPGRNPLLQKSLFTIPLASKGIARRGLEKRRARHL